MKNLTKERLSGLGVVVSYGGIQLLSGILGFVFAMFLLIINPLEALDATNITVEEYQDILMNSSQFTTGSFIGMMICFIVYLVIILILNRKKLVENFSYVKDNFLKFGSRVLVYLVITYAFAMLVGLIDILVFPQYVETAGENQDFIVSALSNGAFFPTALTICFLAPIVEEYVFRYGVMSKILVGFPKVLKVIFSALVFSFIHIGFTQIDGSISMFIHLMLSYIPLALALSIVYARENRIIYPISIHILLNIISTVAIMFTVS